MTGYLVTVDNHILFYTHVYWTGVLLKKPMNIDTHTVFFLSTYLSILVIKTYLEIHMKAPKAPSTLDFYFD